jgi:hypothetical protein
LLIPLSVAAISAELLFHRELIKGKLALGLAVALAIIVLSMVGKIFGPF